MESRELLSQPKSIPTHPQSFALSLSVADTLLSVFDPLLNMLKTRWYCANPFQPIKGFHFLRLYRIK